MKVGLARQISIDGQPFKISGILKETGPNDDEMVFIQLKKAQEVFNKPALVSLIEVSALCYDCPIEEIAAQTSKKLPGAKVTAIRQTINSKLETLKQFRNFSFGISIILLFVSALIMVITMSASVNERTMVIVLGVLASFYPALKASRLGPATALRAV